MRYRSGLLSKTLWSAIAASSVFFATVQAHAYFPGKIEVDGAELKQQPSPTAQTLETLPKGTAFNATDTPRNSYYYIRTAKNLGWIDGAAIGKPNQDQAQNQNAPAAPTKPTPQKKPSKRQASRSQQKKAGLKDPYLVKLHADYNLFSFSDLNKATSSTSFGNGLGVGGDLFYHLSEKTAVGLRIDYISLSISASDATTSSTTDFKISTLAVMGGVQQTFWESGNLYLNGEAFLGLASSSLKFTSNGSATPNETDYSGKAITLLGLLEGGYKLSSTYSIFAEAGYRYLKNSKVQPNPAGNAPSSLFNIPVSLDFTGPLIGIGASARF